MLGEGIQQLYVFLAFTATGALLALPYLFFEGLCKPRFAALLLDGGYGILSLFVLWKLNVQVNNGSFRWFVFLGAALGVTIVCATCKTTLDKLSSALYNLLTSIKVGKDDGKTVLQKGHSHIVDSGNSSSDFSSVHVADKSDAAFQSETNGGKIGKNGRTGKSRRIGKARASELPQHRQVRHRMGNKNESDSGRRHKLHRK